MPQSQEYHILPTFDEPQDWGTENETRNSMIFGVNKRLLYLSCIAALCSSFLTIIVLAESYLTFPAKRDAGAAHNLRHPSTYMNLDRVLGNVSYSFPDITNFPALVFQIRTSDSLRLIAEDVKGWRTPLGSVYPDNRRIVASKEVSTILQYRYRDYAMERCTLIANIPGDTKNVDSSVDSASSTQVDVWLLETSGALRPYLRSGQTRAPRRRRLLTTMMLSAGGNDSYGEFDCPSGDLLNLELSCPRVGRNCIVDFWQDQRLRPAQGIYIKQTFSG
ncbi:hypothetical protein OE88DRAFT_1651847 [Heliocybe sulcata]|uniref:Ubiquitin 3 binding protein But2 C-terminal domain-containing protein n=1 Tax=Heliocybe sulcata TaxID=5364 RepID=A0A5C3NHE5_9AGAM|nr:hypothetical protein OE88DRAFT_1651847 [Heliocybe sulcata]